MLAHEDRIKLQCEELEKAWGILNEAAIELGSHVANLPADVFLSLREVKSMIGLCKSHPKLADLTSKEVDAFEGFCVECCGPDIAARIRCELRNIEDVLVLKAMNEVGSDYALRLQQKTMKAWESTKTFDVPAA